MSDDVLSAAEEEAIWTNFEAYRKASIAFVAENIKHFAEDARVHARMKAMYAAKERAPRARRPHYNMSLV